MLKKILPFELKLLHKNFFTYLIYMAMIFQGVWYMKGFNDMYSSDASLMNSAGNMYIFLCTVGMILMVVISIITGMTLYRDRRDRTVQYFYTLPVNEKDFFMARFTSSFVINVVFCIVYIAGIILSKYAGIAPPDRFGPTQWLQIIHGFLLFTLPNIFLLTVAAYSAVVFFRKMAPSYLAIFAITLIWIIMEGVSGNASTFLPLIKVIDPYSYVYVKFAVDAMGTVNRNTGFLSFDYLFYINRFIWTGGSILLLILARKKFSFQYFFGSSDQKTKTLFTSQDDGMQVRAESKPVPKTKLVFGLKEYLGKVVRLTALEFKNVTRPVSYKIILGGMAIMFILYNILFNPTYYIGASLPVTSNMMLTRLQINFMLIIVIIVWANELFFKEKTVNLWQITETMPLPTWVTLLSKFIAMCGVIMIFAITLIICGVLTQLGQGFTGIDWMLYISDALGYRWGWLTYVLFTAFTLFIGGITGSRYATTILSVGYFIILILSYELGNAEQLRFGFGLVPGIENTYSALNGYGIYETAGFRYFVMWLLMAVVLFLTGIGLWHRGIGKKLANRAITSVRHNPLGVVVITACLAGFGYMQLDIVKNVNDKRNFILSGQEEKEAGLYEKKYSHIAQSAQPKIRNIDLQVNLFPQDRRYDYRVNLSIYNLSEQEIPLLYLNVDYHSRIDEISLDGKALIKESDDDELGMECYKLSQPMPAGSEAVLTIAGSKQYTGFPQEDFQADLAYNGLLIERIFPIIGYDGGKELLENKQRKEQGLAKLASRMSGPEEPRIDSTSLAASDALKVTGQTTVSTPASQFAYAPGKLIETWEKDGRAFFHYKVDREQALYWPIGSGRYEKKTQEADGQKISILYDKKHYFHVDEFMEATGAVLAKVKGMLGAYPFQELRVIEIPFYQDDFYAFANAIAISEKQGWYADLKNREVKAYVYYSIAREIIRQWIQSHAVIADAQGARMLWTALPGALALQVIEEQFGAEQVNKIREKKRIKYDTGRGNEPNVEPPLVYADGMDYLEDNKGIFALYKLSQFIGHERFNAHVSTWIGQHRDKPLVFKAFYDYLKQHHQLEDDYINMFEKVEQMETAAFKQK